MLSRTLGCLEASTLAHTHACTHASLLVHTPARELGGSDAHLDANTHVAQTHVYMQGPSASMELLAYTTSHTRFHAR